jgi:hypothetical protein
MTLFYQSGRVTRFGVGVPGFSTETDLTLAVSGAIGIGTTQPRTSIDTPNISIRGDIFDSDKSTGANGYFLSQDDFGVRWRAGNPLSLATINVQDDGFQVGLGSFDTLNFIGKNDESVVEIKQDPLNPSLADIIIDARFTKTQFGSNFGLSTNFGPDGTFWSLPGYGTSQASGITSVGLGTIQPQDDFQVGIGSTGVQINGALGKVDAQIIRAKNIEIDGNITVESLIVDPGFSTFRGGIDAQGVSTFSADVTVGFATITRLYVNEQYVERFRAGIATLGSGVATNTYTVVNNNLDVEGGIGTFRNDLYVENNLYVGGEQFIKQINAEQIIVTGIATLNVVDGNVGIFTGFEISGITTLGQVGFNTGTGGSLELETADVGIATIGISSIGSAKIGFATIGDAVVSGIATITEVDVEKIDIEKATVGVLTITDALAVTGTSTYIGLVTVKGEVFVDGDLTVTQQFSVQDLGAVNLEVTGIATVNQIEIGTGIATFIKFEDQETTGIGTFGIVDADEVIGAAGTIGGVGFDSGRVEAIYIDADFGRIGILTGNTLDYDAGFITTVRSETGYVGIITGDNLTYYKQSQINGVNFFDDFFEIVNRNVEINSGVTTVNTGPLGGVGFATFSNDVYVGNNLYVGGIQFIPQLITEDLLVSGIATVNNIEVNTGIATFIEFEFQDTTGVGTFKELDIDFLDAERANIGILTVPNFARIRSIVGNDIGITPDPNVPYPFTGNIKTFGLNVSQDATFNNSRQTGIATVKLQDVAREDVGISTINWLTVTGIATISFLDFDGADGGGIKVGIITARKGEFDVIALGNTSINEGTLIDENGIITDNGDYRGILTATTGIFTDANIENAYIGFSSVTNGLTGVSTVGFATITDAYIGVATVGFLTVTGNLSVAGLTTLTGIVTTGDDLYVGNDLYFGGAIIGEEIGAKFLTVTGVATINQLEYDSGFGTALKLERLEVTGISTLGFTTITESLVIREGLVVNGITTFAGVVNIDEVEFVELSVTGIASIGTLYNNVGVITNLYAQTGIVTNLLVPGLSTFQGDADFKQANFENINTGILTVTEQANFENILQSNTGISTLNMLMFSTAVGAGASVGVLTATTGEFLRTITVGSGSTQTGIGSDYVVTTNGVFSGILTAREVDIDELDVESGAIGVATVGFASITSELVGFSTVGFADITDAEVGFLTVTSYATIGTGSTTVGILTVTGVSSFTGVVTTRGNLYVDGDFFVTGAQNVEQLNANQSKIGILTVTNFLDINNLVQRPTGFSTFHNISFNTGVGTELNVGVLTASDLEAGFATVTNDLKVNRNLVVSGITTLGAIGTTGITTIVGDLYIGGDLFVQDDIFYDEISGRNLNITGIGTIATLNVPGVGTIGTITGNDLYYPVGFISALTSNAIGATTLGVTTATIGFATVTDLFAGVATITTLNTENIYNSGLTSTANLNVDVQADLENLKVSGVSTFVGFVSFTNDVSVGGTVTIEDDVSIGSSVTVPKIYTDYIDADVANIGIATVGFSTIVGAFVGVATALKLDFGIGIGSHLTVKTNLYALGFSSIAQESVGFSTVGVLTAVNATIGVATVTDLDIKDTISVRGYRTVVAPGDTGIIFSDISAADYGSFEITMQVTQGSDIQSVKLHGVVDALGNVFNNEYSSIFNNVELTDYEFFFGSGNIILEVDPISVVAPTTYTVNATFTRR